jgi:hypothetical protein
MSAMSDLAIDIEELVKEGKPDAEIMSIMVTNFGIPQNRVQDWLESVKDNMFYPEEDQNEGLDGWGEL